MIIDCFTFFNELDLLEARFELLYNDVDFFVFSEASQTHSGDPKPFYFYENRDRFAKWLDKVIYIPVVVDSDFSTSWHLENLQRNVLFDYLPHDLQSSDIIMISDLDEFPRIEIVPAVLQTGEVYRLVQNMRFYHANWRRASLPYWFGGTVLVNFETLTAGLKFSTKLDYGPGLVSELNFGLTATKLRLNRYPKLILRGGVHLSYFGGFDRISKKLEATAHQELPTHFRDLKYIESRINSGNDVLSHDRLLVSDNVLPVLDKFCCSENSLCHPSIYLKVIDGFRLFYFLLKNFVLRNAIW